MPKLNLTELTLDVISSEVTRAVNEERERCIAVVEWFVGDGEEELIEAIRQGWKPNE